jgi:hypothetical protein
MAINLKAEASFFLGFLSAAAAVLFPRVRIEEVGLLGLVVFPALAVVLGILGRRDSRRSGGRIGGAGLAGWGIGLGACSSLLGCVLGVASDPYPHESTRRAIAINNLKQIGLALYNYQRAEGRLPPAASRDRDGRPLLSWRVLILPYLEEENLYRQFRLDEPWDSPHNLPLSARIPPCYAPLYRAASRPDAPAGLTFYQAFLGPGTAFEDPRGELPAPDGAAPTILVVEAGEGVPWTKPADLIYDPGAPLPTLGGAQVWRRAFERRPRPADGFFALLSDGTARDYRLPIDEPALRALIVRDGGAAHDDRR